MERALSAPGKLFVSGEYAVLWGGVARVAAAAARTAAFVRRRADARRAGVEIANRVGGHGRPPSVRRRKIVTPISMPINNATPVAGRDVHRAILDHVQISC